jgi:diketogulonate reductase-like aldo/keto reductase
MDVEVLKTLGTFGALGLICAWLLWKDYAVGTKERHSRHILANAITANTAITEQLVKKLEDLDRAIWQFILTRGGTERRKDES